ncbi:MAG TPA: response regulator [Lacunisphaera sp.]
MDAPNPIEMLLVEDNAYDLELAMRALQKANLASVTHVARDGAEALDFIFGTGVFAGQNMLAGLKVVVLDLRLPKVDGLEVVRRLREQAETRLVPVVMLTGSREQPQIAQAYQLGVTSYVLKPWIFEYYAEVIRDIGLYWLRRNQLPREGK